MDNVERVTVSLPADLIRDIDRLEKNRTERRIDHGGPRSDQYGRTTSSLGII